MCNTSQANNNDLYKVIMLSQLKIISMNKNEAEGKRLEQEGILKQKFATLTENDPLFAEGKKEEKLGKRQIKSGVTKKE